MATGAPGTNGVWQYGEDDSEATFSALLNKAAATTNTQIGLDRGRLTTLEAKPTAGLVPIAPSSVDKTGGTATANTLGQVTFTGVSSLSLNGVFSTNYRNYRIIIDCQGSVSGTDLWLRGRTSGTDYSTAGYYWGGMRGNASGTSSVWYANATTAWRLILLSTNTYNEASIDIFTPKVAVKTKLNCIATGSDVSTTFGAFFGGLVDTDNSFDGFTIYTGSGNMTGSVQVFGYND